jgi:hypothetical protein
LCLGDPVQRASGQRPRLVRVAAVLAHTPLAVGVAQAVDAGDDALHAERRGELVDQLRSLERRRIDRYLVGAGVQDCARVGDAAYTAGNAERNIDDAGDAFDPGAIDRALLRARRDVVEHEFVGAGVTVTPREILDRTHDDVVAEADSLDDFALAHVEAWNYAPRQHG